MTPRLVYPHQRIDAVRGAVAVERGPLVYCFEQVDQAPGVDVEDLALADGDTRLVTEEAELPGVGRTVVVRADAYTVAQPRNGFPYSTTPPEALAHATPTTAVAVPYFQWDNRDGGPMRVWLPRHRRST